MTKKAVMGIARGVDNVAFKQSWRDIPGAPADQTLRQTSKQSYLYQIPVVNIIYEGLFDTSPPSVEEVKEALNVMGLLSALLITVAMSIPGSVDYDELHEVVARFDVHPYNSWDGGGRIVVQELMAVTEMSVTCLGNSVVGVVFSLASIAFSTDYVSTAELYRIWYSWQRWIVFWVILNTAAGCVLSFIAFNLLMKIKFPDFRIEDGDTDISVWDATGISSSLNFYRQIGNFALLLPGIIILIINGAANTAVIRGEQGHPDEAVADSHAERKEKGTDGEASGEEGLQAAVAPSEAGGGGGAHPQFQGSHTSDVVTTYGVAPGAGAGAGAMPFRPAAGMGGNTVAQYVMQYGPVSMGVFGGQGDAPGYGMYGRA